MKLGCVQLLKVIIATVRKDSVNPG